MPPRWVRPCSPSPPPGCVRGCRRRRDQPTYRRNAGQRNARAIFHRLAAVGRCPPPAARSSPGAASLRPRAAAGSARRAALPAQRRAEPGAREQRRSLWPVAGRAPAHRPGRPGRRRGVCAGLRRRCRRLPDSVGRHHRRPLGQLAGPPHPRATATRQPGAEPDGSLSGPRDTQIPTASAFGALVTTNSRVPTHTPAPRPTLATSVPHGHRRRHHPATAAPDPGAHRPRAVRGRPPDTASPWRHCCPPGSIPS